MIIRAMTLADMPTVMQIQSECYFDIEPESETSMKAKVIASPTTCFVAEHQEIIQGYLIGLPCDNGNTPTLNSPVCMLPSQPDSFYLHDLAIAKPARGSGAAKQLIQAFLAAQAKAGFKKTYLIAIQNSEAYWNRYGFVTAKKTQDNNKKLLSYGNNTKLMIRKGNMNDTI